MYLNDVFTVTVNLAGLPGVAVPAGLDAQGLPLGLQLIGRPWEEAGMLNVAAARAGERICCKGGEMVVRLVAGAGDRVKDRMPMRVLAVSGLRRCLAACAAGAVTVPRTMC